MIETALFSFILLPSFQDYTEDYVQTGAGSLYAYSDRLVSFDGYIMPYTWQHNITYNQTRGRVSKFFVENTSNMNIHSFIHSFFILDHLVIKLNSKHVKINLGILESRKGRSDTMSDVKTCRR